MILKIIVNIGKCQQRKSNFELIGDNVLECQESLYNIFILVGFTLFLLVKSGKSIVGQTIFDKVISLYRIQ